MKKLLLVLGLTLWAGEAYAHGVGFRQSELKAMSLEFFYSTGEKMSYCEVRVFSPSDDKFAVQTGRTDEQGRFAFIPDTSGEWRVIVRDEEGHQCNASVNIAEEFLSGKAQPESQAESSLPQGWELFMRGLLGVSIIFNIAMFILRRSGHAH